MINGGIFMKKKIFYFTGTGNSMRAAQIIALTLKDTEIISMRQSLQDVTAEDCDVIGFVFPVYHWSMPEPAVKFIQSLKINKDAYIFCISMPSFICGCSCEKLEELLKEKGAKISYGNKVYSVANYVIAYPPLPPPKLIVPKTEKKLEKIASDILNRKLREIPRANFIIKNKIKTSMNTYRELQRYADMGFKINEKCISCGLCAKVCPVDNIELIDKKPNFKNNCTQCMACVSYCPKRAIGYKIDNADIEKLNVDKNKIKIVKIMKLPDKRKCYHNPYITANDISKESIKY